MKIQLIRVKFKAIFLESKKIFTGKSNLYLLMVIEIFTAQDSDAIVL